MVINMAFSIFFASAVFAQNSQKGPGKPAIDTSVLGKWPEISGSKISNDGKYSVYIITEKITPGQKLVVVSNETLKKMEIPRAEDGASFTADSRKCLFLNGLDSLGIVDLKTAKIRYVPNVASFTAAKVGNWFAYLEKDSRQLTVKNSLSGKQQIIPQVLDYTFTPDGKKLVVRTPLKQGNSDTGQELHWIDLATGNDTKVLDAHEIANITMANSSDKLAFSAKASSGDHPSLYLFDQQEGITRCIASDQMVDSLKSASDIANLYFSKYSDKILFSIKKRYSYITTKPSKDPGLIVWNYRDFPQKDEKAGRTGHFGYWFSNIWYGVDLKNSRVTQLDRPGMDVVWGTNPGKFENYLLFTYSDPYKHKDNDVSFYLVSLNDASQKLLARAGSAMYDLSLNPGEEFAVWYDLDSLSFYSYNVQSGGKAKIGVPYPVCDTEVVENEALHFPPYGIAGWSADGHSAYFYDEFDIWKIDLEGKTPPFNLTGGAGRKNHLSFSFVDPDLALSNGAKLVEDNRDVILEGFNTDTKDNGFWRKKHDSQLPEKLNISSHCYYWGRTNDNEAPDIRPWVLKARDADIYIVGRQAATEFPNLYTTRDFKNFRAISDLHPEKDFNWYTTELVTWKLPDGRTSQGVLYKPENFNPTKKYPVLIHYFERKSDRLNGYLVPGWSSATVDIPFYVSSGYLVFTPDIHWRRGHQGQSSTETLVSAAHCLAARPYVDSTRIGIMGHSWAGWQTNFTVTHSQNVFAAACTGAGMSDLVSVYDESVGNFPADYLENRIAGFGKTPWNSTELYIENSPILSADKTTTPLLIMQGSQDTSTPFWQGIEMYEGLHRAGKKVWLLQYTNSGHSVVGQDIQDFTVRMKQFFDYYLMGAPAPVWMTKGVQNFSNENTGLQLDTSGAKP